MIIPAPPTDELIVFGIWLEPHYWNNPPVVDILIDQQLISTIRVDKDMHHSFSHRLNFSSHSLTIKRYGKDHNETRPDGHGGYDTQSLTIGKITIDNINVRNILWDQAEFYPDYPEPWASEQISAGHQLENKVIGEMILGHNGTWVFNFSSPFYKFMVDFVRKPQ